MLKCDYRQRQTYRVRVWPRPPEIAERYYCHAAEGGVAEVTVGWCRECPVPETLASAEACAGLDPVVLIYSHGRGAVLWRCVAERVRELGPNTEACQGCSDFTPRHPELARGSPR